MRRLVGSKFEEGLGFTAKRSMRRLSANSSPVVHCDQRQVEEVIYLREMRKRWRNSFHPLSSECCSAIGSKDRASIPA